MFFRYAIVPMLLCAVLSVSARGASAQEEPALESPVLQSLNEQYSQGSAASELPFNAPGSLPLYSPSSSVFRDIPSISGRYSVGGRTILPYLGAGFGGGYTSELNRSLTGPPPVQPDVGLRNQLGQGISPNEFQMGLRIPF
jgi:hypothetical protein